MSKLKRFSKIKGLIATVILVALVLFSVGWRYTNLPVYRLVVHEITKAAEDDQIIFSGALDINASFALLTYDYTGITDVSLTDEMGNIILLKTVATSAVTEYHVFLPPITEALDGFIITIKNAMAAGTTTVPIITGCTDSNYKGTTTIESTDGTDSGVSYILADAAGDAVSFIADYSSTTPVWRKLWEDIT